jgi:hypothetical protein
MYVGLDLLYVGGNTVVEGLNLTPSSSSENLNDLHHSAMALSSLPLAVSTSQKVGLDFLTCRAAGPKISGPLH